MPPCEFTVGARDASPSSIARSSTNKDQTLNLSQLRKQIPKE